MVTKNNPHVRGRTVEVKHKGKKIEPVFYYGKYSGHGNYMAAQYEKTNDMICDEQGKPIPWNLLKEENNLS